MLAKTYMARTLSPLLTWCGGTPTGEPKITSFTKTTVVEFDDLPIAAIEAYVASGDALDSKYFSPISVFGPNLAHARQLALQVRYSLSSAWTSA